MSAKLRKTIILNLRWHRRLGLTAAIAVIFLAVTGLLLNHATGLKLEDRYLNSTWLLGWYGFDTASLSGFPVEGRWLSHPGGLELFLDTQPAARCQPPLLSATTYQGYLLALCSDSLIMLTKAGELVESLGQHQGLPAGADALQVVDGQLLVRVPQNILALDFDTLSSRVAEPPQNGWPASRSLPGALRNQLHRQGELPGISLETLLLDLHSGRFFGVIGVLFVDLMGVLLCLLALTGVWAWINHHRLKKLNC